MSPLIAALLSIFGPLIADLLKKLLDKWLNKAERNIKGKLEKAGSEKESQLLVLKETLRILPAVAVVKKRVVKAMIKAVESGGSPQENDAAIVEVLGKVD